MKKHQVHVIMGSANDADVMLAARDVLDSLAIPHEISVASAHRSPDRLQEIVRKADREGVDVFIAGAGMANHLAGSVAALTTQPVIGVPLSSAGGTVFGLNGADALLSTVQMPPGVPVLTVGVDRAENAAIAAAQIVGIYDADVAKRLKTARGELLKKVLNGDADVKKRIELEGGRQ